MDKAEIILEARNLKKTYQLGQENLQVLKDINFALKAKDSVSIQGSSGAGKSTFLHILGTLDRPDSGEIIFAGNDLLQSADEDLARFRNQNLGFVFQFHHLIGELNALENVTLPSRIAGENMRLAQQRAEELLQFMGLQDRLKHFPNELSGGELQRVAIARSLIRRPQILLADEPTGNLDSKNAAKVQELFLSLREKFNLALVVVTHDPQFARSFSRQLMMRDGAWQSGG